MSNMDFIELTFDDVTSSSLGLYVVSNSGRYTSSLSPQFENRTTSVSGRPGLLYWGTDLGVQEFQIQLATDGMTSTQLNKFKETFIPNKVGKLSFKEGFYKYYYVILNSPPTMSFVPFANSANNESVYKGEIELSFTTIEPYAYSDLTLAEGANINNINIKESGLLKITDFPASDNVYYYLSKDIIVRNGVEVQSPTSLQTPLTLYNAGNVEAETVLSFDKSFTLSSPGSSPSKSSWTANNSPVLSIGGIRLIKPRFLVGIDNALALVHQNESGWNDNRENVIIALMEELDGPAKPTIINIISNYKNRAGLNSLAELTATFRIAFFTNVVYTFILNGLTKQAILKVVGSKYYTNDFTSFAQDYEEDNAGCTNGKFLTVRPGGSTGLQNGKTTYELSESLSKVKVSFRNTYI